VGLPDRLIDYLPSLPQEAIQYYSCFISYSSKGDAFAQRLHADLKNTGVRCWFAPYDLTHGLVTASLLGKCLANLVLNPVAGDRILQKDQQQLVADPDGRVDHVPRLRADRCFPYASTR
jgi:hypothetical protein